jgi:DNA-binding response OmpR family regulator
MTSKDSPKAFPQRESAASSLSNLLRIIVVSGRDRSAELAQFAAVGISLLVLASYGDDLFANIDSSTLVFLDWMLPCFPTLEICRQIKNRQGLEDVHVTVLLEHDDDRDRRQALGAGADDYMVGKSSLPDIIGRARTTGFCLEAERMKLAGA